MSEKTSYEALGVSASKSGLHDALNKVGLGSSDSLFAKINSDIAGDPAYCSVVHCDGAGTKSIIPYLYFRETGDRSLFAGLAQDATVMNLDDIYCIGAPDSLVLANAIGRNANLIDDQVLGILIGSYKSLVEKFSALGIPLELSGGETADCGDVVRTLMVDAVICARLKRDALIHADRIAPGDCIVGLSSTGQASYEDQPNSGIGSNGLTLARHALLSSSYPKDFPEVVNPLLDPEVIYRGRFKVSDKPAELQGLSIGQALASPTRSYAPVIAKLLSELGLDAPRDIHGIIHLTGGGQTKMLRFGGGNSSQGNLFIKDQLFDLPPLFALIQAQGKVSWKEMYRVFNMGHRLEVYLPERLVPRVIEIAREFNITAKQIGRVEQNSKKSASGNELLLRSGQGEFRYSL